MRAILLNCSLEKGSKETDTEQLLDAAARIFQKEKIDVERIHLRDFHIEFGITQKLDQEEDWPFIFEKILEADIILLGTPITMGDKSSLASLVLERLQGYHQMTNQKGQGVFYNKVGGAIIADGGYGGSQAAAQSIQYYLSMLGFTLPPHSSAVCQKHDHSKDQIDKMTYNLIHFAEILTFHPIPVTGNRIRKQVTAE
ncbi:NAD(P)H-dependent oxidoreductase [Halobacillus sp. ACCC02827]|uniref:flavodoxin family protein n=1 Tax=Bacillaceae TaxID=186817 RepID=UPI0002A4F94D|nr:MULTISPECIES: NAD(P)H-dependent oxidoreductase [Bacillaceae]ELK47594.1 hypothetical protein D479_05830 [Halobacillus sp. BAB-2008]QHT45910.1 flavodoxin family protein [Bacillus sp. SB49]WJE16717.1 NAD(P)H-dependent oxidoreductase [Halobacillus sp. ACCC02827]